MTKPIVGHFDKITNFDKIILRLYLLNYIFKLNKRLHKRIYSMAKKKNIEIYLFIWYRKWVYCKYTISNFEKW